MKTANFLLAILISFTCCGQSFEGKIVYKNTYRSKVDGVTDQQFAAMLGSTQEYFIKDGSYKSVTNGSSVQWQLYVNKENRLYTKIATSEALFWNDGLANPDTVFKAEFKPKATQILGYDCDELILTCKSGIQKYYFNSSFSVDPKLFVNHKFGNWHEYISRAKSVPLASKIENTQFTFENLATEIIPMKLENVFFKLPDGVKIIKSPY